TLAAMSGFPILAIMNRGPKLLFISVLLGAIGLFTLVLISKLRRQAEALLEKDRQVEQLRSEIHFEESRASKAEATGVRADDQANDLRQRIQRLQTEHTQWEQL